MAIWKAALALAVLAVGGVGFLAVSGSGPMAPGGEGVAAGPAGSSGMTLAEESRAVAAVRAHLREGRPTGELAAVALYPLGRPNEVVVCGTLDRLPVVARVLLGQADAAGVARTAQEGRVPAQAGAPMVILESGPGLPRGTSLGGPWERYCRGPQPAPPEAVATGADAMPVAVDSVAVDSAVAPSGQERVAVMSPVRVRSGPNGSAEVLLTAPRGRVLTVYGRAPGGWLQVGEDGTPLGWAHSSLLGSAP